MLSVVSGQGILYGPLERWSAGMLFRPGIRLQAAAASCPHVRVLRVGQGASGMGANVVVNESIFCVFRKSAPPMLTAALPSLYDQDPDSRPALHTDAIDTHWNGSTSITNGTMLGRKERLGIRNMKGAHGSREGSPIPPREDFTREETKNRLPLRSLLREGSGGEGRRARALYCRRQGKPQAKKKQLSCSQTPTEGQAAVASAIKKRERAKSSVKKETDEKLKNGRSDAAASV